MAIAQARCNARRASVPDWVAAPVRAYLDHTEAGTSVRALARAADCHPSTVLRQVRRYESLRDDPLVDAALDRLGRMWRRRAGTERKAEGPEPMSQIPDDATLARESLRVLRALMEPDTLLVIADGVEDAVVVRNAESRPVRRAVLRRDVAEALALNGWIAGRTTGRIARYSITAAGRAEARRLMAAAESRRAAASGEEGEIVEAGTLFGAPKPAHPAKRSAGTAPPLDVLARRRMAGGEAWLPPELVAAALRFRESWELARIGGRITSDWDRLLSGRVAVAGGGAEAAGRATRRLEAEESLAAAIRALGPDLAETVLLGVCEEEGMEEIEARLGFPARSGKIVIRIALRSLARHYASVGNDGYDLIW